MEHRPKKRTPSSSELHALADACLTGFRELTEHLRVNPDRVPFARLSATWNRYYFGKFGRLDAAIRSCVATGANDYEAFIQVSTSHHNLHRLMEVLSRDLTAKQLGAATIPERTIDLIEMCRRIEGQLESLNGSPLLT